MKSCRRLLPLLTSLLVLTACATDTLNESFVSEPYVRERWLYFLEDGKTRKDDIIRRLGEPTSTYEGITILGYRLVLIEDGRNITEKDYRTTLINHESAYRHGYFGWINDRRKVLSEKGTLFTVREGNKEDKLLEILSREAEYSLVLVFDDENTLARHRLRRIMP